MQTQSVPLCVDLDGTLLRSNSLYEAVAALARQNPLWLLLVPVWLLRGQAYLWCQVANRVRLNPQSLPYRHELIAWLSKHRGEREIVLVTGASQRVAEEIALHLGLFDKVFGTSDSVHLTGPNKQRALIACFGERGFDYVGDSSADLSVWRSARRSFCVTKASGISRQISRENLEVEALNFDTVPRSPVKIAAKLMRIHQWLKNALVLVPIVTSHRITLDGLTKSALTVAAFCCCASATYIINDLLDLEADRRHPTKRNRPIAAGVVSIPAAFSVSAILLLAAIGISLLLPLAAAVVVALYFAITLAYSGWIKKLVLADVFVLAGLYTLRVFGGGAATGIVVSAWTLAFFMFLFLSLALLKRYTEMARLPDTADETTNLHGRGYRRGDVDFVSQCGIGCALVSVLVFALYINSPEVHAVYKHPQVLWLMDPLLAYGVLSMWLAGYRGIMHDDPVIYAAKDWFTYALGAAGAVVVVLASL
jgi:4-hydroxybenzoate polyprenyltransferase